MGIYDGVQDSSILITGGSKGIGYYTAEAALKNGASKVIIVARDSEAFSKAEFKLRKLAGKNERVLCIRADLSSLNGPALIIQHLLSSGIKVNHLINNAGYTKPAPIYETDISDFKTTINVNVYAPFLLIKDLVRMNVGLKTIINIASTAGIQGRPGWLTYSASKAALIAMSETLRAELAPDGIKVVCLSPGRCATDLRKTLAPNEDPSTIMQPSQVADVLMMYLSDLGRLIDSENIVVRT